MSKEEVKNKKRGFVECDTCKAKIGSPLLCEGCIKNRETIILLEQYKTLSDFQIEILRKLLSNNIE